MSITFKDIQARISTSINTFFKNLEDESRLPPIEIPPLYKIKSAHHELLQAYVYVIKATTRQPFLMPNMLIRGLNKQNFWKNTLLLFARYNPIRLINLRPLALLAINFHIFNKLKELEKAYTQFTYLIPKSNDERDAYLEWLKTARQEISELRETITSGMIIWNIVKTIGISFGGLLVAFYGVNSMYDVILKVFSTRISQSEIVRLIPIFLILLILVLYGSIFIGNTFNMKRALFKNLEQTSINSSLYSLENALFFFLNRRKHIEFPVDYAIKFLNDLFFWGFVLLLLNQITVTKYTEGVQQTTHLNFNKPMLVVLLILTVVRVVPFYKRVNKKDC